MSPDIVVGVATFVIVLWLLTRLGSARPVRIEVDPDLERARQYIRTKVDEHTESLAKRYDEAREGDPRGDRASALFAREIEWFIGNILLHDVVIENPEIAPALREVVTLEREHVYDLILSRFEDT
jgi:hypothetical protein